MGWGGGAGADVRFSVAAWRMEDTESDSHVMHIFASRSSKKPTPICTPQQPHSAQRCGDVLRHRLDALTLPGV